MWTRTWQNHNVVCKLFHSKLYDNKRYHIINRVFKLHNWSIRITMGEINFVQRLSPGSGKLEWIEQPNDYDFHQEIARAAYADMLHDHDRNMKYYEALKIAVRLKHEKGEEAIVLDIGTGTGLLSMQAIRAGADVVYACEAFKPMAECAKNVLKRNNVSDKIKLIPKRSTELEVGPGKDLERRANILVTEVFDTELIGEGAIFTFNHANENLLTEDCTIIPQKATIYAQVVNCPLIKSWNVIEPISLPNGIKIKLPEKVAECYGVPSVHDLQLSELKPSEFKSLSQPLPIFEFDWSTKTLSSRPSVVKFVNELKESIEANGVFMWWDLLMDPLSENIISCQPNWLNGENASWRDHWMQAIYYLPNPLTILPESTCYLESFHDEFSLWFNLALEAPKLPLIGAEERPICHCGIHTVLSRSRIGMINDKDRIEKFRIALEKVIEPGESVCLCISESSLLPLIAAGLGAKKVFVVDTVRPSAAAFEEFIALNHMENIVTIIPKFPDEITPEDLPYKIDVVFGDPFFQSSVYPWNNLLFWFALKFLRWSFSPNVSIVPCKGHLKGLPVQFEHLWKIKAPVGKACLGEFDLIDFDNLIKKSLDVEERPVDAEPLWEYPGIPTGPSFQIASFDFTTPIESVERFETRGEVEQDGSANLNGIALWMDWELEDNLFISTGPKKDPVVGQKVIWDMYSKQGVYLFWKNIKKESQQKITYECLFNPNNGDVNFTFKQLS